MIEMNHWKCIGGLKLFFKLKMRKDKETYDLVPSVNYK